MKKQSFIDEVSVLSGFVSSALVNAYEALSGGVSSLGWAVVGAAHLF